MAKVNATDLPRPAIRKSPMLKGARLARQVRKGEKAAKTISGINANDPWLNQE
jgi:hypothetical protein